MGELIFLVEEAAEGGYSARALGHSIFTQGETIEEIREVEEIWEVRKELDHPQALSPGRIGNTIHLLRVRHRAGRRQADHGGIL